MLRLPDNHSSCRRGHPVEDKRREGGDPDGALALQVCKGGEGFASREGLAGQGQEDSPGSPPSLNLRLSLAPLGQRRR